VPVSLHQIETERLDVELLGIRQMRDVQMHVPDPRVGRKTSPGVRVVAKLLEQGLNIQRRRTHLQPPADSGPFTLRTISIHLDAVSVRIGQVEGLADAVIGEALHRRRRVDETTKRLGQLESSRHEDGEVVKTCGAVHTYRRLRFCEDQEIWSLGAEPGGRILTVSQREAKTRLIEVNGAIEIRDREVDRTDGGRGVYF